MDRFLKYWLPACAWMSLIFLMSTDLGSAANTSRFIEPFLRWLIPNISTSTIQQVHFCIRKSAHLVEYAMLGWLFWRALRQTRLANVRGSSWKIAAVALLMSVAYAAADEYHQSFVPARTASVRDVMLDVCGSLVGLTIVEVRAALRGESSG
jgi:VanZ family protein